MVDRMNDQKTPFEVTQNEPTLPSSPDLLLRQYVPPYDIISDLLIAVAFCPTAMLSEHFPDLRFLSIAGRTPLVLWLGRIKAIYYQDAEGIERRMGSADAPLYNEVNLMAPLRQRAVFVPALYATSELSVQIAEAYRMPKQLSGIGVTIEGKKLTISEKSHSRHLSVAARLIGSGTLPGRLSSILCPLQSWPARFPSGSSVRTLQLAVPRIQLAYINERRLSLSVPWLPESISLLPAGVFLSNHQMRLPPP